MKYPIVGMSQEAIDFDRENKEKIIGWTSETKYSVEQKTITFELSDGRTATFEFPFSKMLMK